MKRLGDIYYTGTDSIARNFEQAATYYHLSSVQGNPEAQNNLAIMYEEGIGVEQNLNKSISWYTVSSKNVHFFEKIFLNHD